jgi:serine/threonine-protein kinase
VDFGIALLTGHSGHSGGTPAYMAPEQWQGGPATPATDVYAATCVFFLCVTGFRPFTDTDTERLRHAHQFGAPPVEQVPEPVRALVARGMAKDVAARPAGAAAFVAELEAAAKAAYGKDWESTGWQRLAGYAGTLLAASPMAWLVSSTGVLASGGATAAGAAGSAVGSAAAAKTAAGAVAAKIAAAVVAVAVVTGATVIVINTTGDDPPAVTQEALAVNTVTEQASYPVRVDVSAQVVQVSGVGNAAALNEALRGPVDARIRDVRHGIGIIRDDMRKDGDDRWDAPTDIKVTATVLLRNSNYVSVRYDNRPNIGSIANSSWQSYDTVTVDVRTGKALTREQIFRPGAPGALLEALLAHTPDRLCEDGAVGAGADDLALVEDNLGKEVTVAFTRDHASFTIELPAFGRTSACGIRTVDIPYADLADVLDPNLVGELTSG